MPVLAKHVGDYGFTAADKLFLDTNIWLYLYSPRSREKKADEYDEAFKRILDVKSDIYIHIAVVSEYVNAYARMTYHLSGGEQKFGGFKNFRDSLEFREEIARDIAGATKQVLKYCKWVETYPGKPGMDGLIEKYSEGNSDFNDLIIGGLCREKGLRLITDDKDFRDHEVPILTANPKLLNRRP